MINCLISGFRGKQYPENIRRFCLRQCYHSPAAYQSLRLFFKKNLPSKRTLQMWYTSIDGEPGISSSALEIIREKAKSYQAEKNHALHVALISDEMAIKKQICYSTEKQSFVGFSSITNSSVHFGDQENVLNIAKDALVFLIVGPDFKLPVGYQLLNGLESIDRAALTIEFIKRIEEAGVIVMSFTCDGCRSNVATIEFLGAQLSGNKPYFYSPTYPNQKIYSIWDPPHMLKLVRKQLKEKKLYHEDQLLDWNLLCILEEKQRMENFDFFNKLTTRHINWQQKPMNVRLAAQTISKSVSDALIQLHNDGYEDFRNALGTAKFLLMFNDGFDIMNMAANDPIDGRYKQPICEATIGKLFPYLEKFKEYIEQIQIENKTSRKPVIESSVNMGFLGFASNVTSLKGIYHDFIQNGPLEFFYTMQMSQDHLESTFSLFRNQQGSNDNPNAIEFRSAFKKLLVCHPLLTSQDHNVISNATEILTVPSTIKKRTALANPVSIQEPELVIEMCYDSLVADEMDSLDSYQKHMCAYMALLTEQNMSKQINRAHKSSCVLCFKVFSENEKIKDSLLAMKHVNHEEAEQPCKSTIAIVVFSNAVLKIHSSNAQNIAAACKVIGDNICINDLYNSSNFVHAKNKNHKVDFVHQVIKTFLTLKSRYVSKRITEQEAGPAIRNRLNAVIHLVGQ